MGEKSSVQTDGKNHIADVKDVDGLERKLKESLNNEKELKIQVETLTAKAAENTEVMAHQEKMKRQRDDLEKRVAEGEKASNQLSEVEDELKNVRDAKKMDEEKLSKVVESESRLKLELEETKGELKVLKKATKTGAKDAQEVIEIKAKNDELLKEIDRLNSVAIDKSREQGAISVLKSELEHKSREISQVQEKVEDLHSSLGAKNKEISLLTEKVEYLQSNIDAKDYDLGKTKEERDKLMEHYDKMLKKKREELDNIK